MSANLWFTRLCVGYWFQNGWLRWSFACQRAIGYSFRNSFSAKGITTLYAMGAIERDNGWGEVDPESSDPSIKSALDLARSHGLLPSDGMPNVDPNTAAFQLTRLQTRAGIAPAAAGQYIGKFARRYVLVCQATDVSTNFLTVLYAEVLIHHIHVFIICSHSCKS
jgi:hypothetical protein